MCASGLWKEGLLGSALWRKLAHFPARKFSGTQLKTIEILRRRRVLSANWAHLESGRFATFLAKWMLNLHCSSPADCASATAGRVPGQRITPELHTGGH